MKQAEDKIKVFLEAIPWIKEFKGNIFVLKYGGELLTTKKNIDYIAEDIDLLCTLGIRLVVVHGGGPQLDEELKKQEIRFEKVDGMRVTSREIQEVSKGVFGDIANKIQKSLGERGIKTRIISSDYLGVNRIKELDLVGKVSSVKHDLQKILKGCNVAIMPISGYDEGGVLCNVNADDVAVSAAEALNAEKLVIHTSVDGVLDERGERITHLDLKKAEKMIEDDQIKGGMIPKVLHALESEKVNKIHIINGQTPHALLHEVFTREGIGTEIVRD